MLEGNRLIFVNECNVHIRLNLDEARNGPCADGLALGSHKGEKQ
jgi:hypothetical protein